MVDEDYEIISHKEVVKLKQEIKNLREGNVSGSSANIISQLNNLIELFREASETIKNDKPISDKVTYINEKLDRVLEQNQKMAEGILAIADLIKKTKDDTHVSEIQPFQDLNHRMQTQPKAAQAPPKSKVARVIKTSVPSFDHSPNSAQTDNHNIDQMSPLPKRNPRV